MEPSPLSTEPDVLQDALHFCNAAFSGAGQAQHNFTENAVVPHMGHHLLLSTQLGELLLWLEALIPTPAGYEHPSPSGTFKGVLLEMIPC